MPACRPSNDLAESGTEGPTTALQEFLRASVPLLARGDPPEEERPAVDGTTNRAKATQGTSTDNIDYRTSGAAAAIVPRIIAEHWGDAAVSQ